MNKVKLLHDFLNSTVVINSIAKSANNLVDKIAQGESVSEKQIELFKQSMNAIQAEVNKIKSQIELLLNQLPIS